MATTDAPLAALNALDDFEKKREEQRAIVLSCQQARGLNSCFACDKTLECETRTQYVNAVYLSMSKGKSGSFDF
ncbi:MAG: hypothetical protein LBC09_02330 [Helicobacteraceae bacterium]|jgi:hypothetical protein|nr:hypothetical protein [Helicobacteraceae bacterium]